MNPQTTLKAETTATRTASTQNRRNTDRLVKANERDLSILGESDEQVARLLRERRNRKREEATEEKNDQSIVDGHGYLDNARPPAYFHNAVRDPDDSFDVPGWFLKELTKLARTITTTPKRSPIVFENNQSAAIQNEAILKSIGFSVENSYQSTRTQHSCMGPSLGQ